MNLTKCSSTPPFIAPLYVTLFSCHLYCLISFFSHHFVLNLLSSTWPLLHSFFFALSLFGLGLYSPVPHAIYSSSLFHLLSPPLLFLSIICLSYFHPSLLVLLWLHHLHFTCHLVHSPVIFTSFTSSFFLFVLYIYLLWHHKSFLHHLLLLSFFHFLPY